jgi:hypothetical protein
MVKSLVLVGALVSLVLLISCGSFIPAPEVFADMGLIVGETVSAGQTFTLNILEVTFKSHNKVDAVLRSVSLAAYHDDVLLTQIKPYPAKFIDGIQMQIPPAPDSSILAFPIPITDEVNWMFTPAPDTIISVELRLIFEGEDAFGEGKEWTYDQASYGISRWQ